MAEDIVERLRRAAVGMPQDNMNQTAADEIERLQRWKVEACSVLADWDALYVSLADRGELGQRKSAVVAAEIERLRAAGDAIVDAVFAVSVGGLLDDMDTFISAIDAWREARRG